MRGRACRSGHSIAEVRATNGRSKGLRIGMLIVLCCAMARVAGAQTLGDALGFLLTNRSVSTDDFVRDELAAAANRETITRLLTSELATIPITSSSGGFSYRLDPQLGVSVRSSNSFGPFFSERSLTIGQRRVSLAFSYRRSSFDEIDGRSLRTGTLVATAARLRGETRPFDVETLTLKLRTETMTLFGNVGLSDRLDVGVAVPMVHVVLDGTRVDTYRGTSVVQAVASGSTTGPGDLVVRAKYNVIRGDGGGIAVGVDARLPTGDEKNLRGTGEAAVTPRFIASLETARAGLHGNVGGTFGGPTRDLDYRGAVTVVAGPRVTLVGELAGRRLASVGRLVDVSVPHPTVPNIETTRLSSAEGASNRLFAVAGFKWNVASTWLLAADLLTPLTHAGLRANWTPTVTLDYLFGR